MLCKCIFDCVSLISLSLSLTLSLSLRNESSFPSPMLSKLGPTSFCNYLTSFVDTNNFVLLQCIFIFYLILNFFNCFQFCTLSDIKNFKSKKLSMNLFHIKSLFDTNLSLSLKLIENTHTRSFSLDFSQFAQMSDLERINFLC